MDFLKPAERNRFLEIDAIRGLSAIIILVYHYVEYIYSVNRQSNWILSFTDYGKYAVHAFFIASGFLIFMTLEKIKNPRYFIFNRFSRLYPAYWVCMALTAIVVTISPYYNRHQITFLQFLANLTMFQHWMLIEDIDGVYWTLAVEMCFYVLLFAVFIFKQQKNIERIGVAWLALMVMLFLLIRQEIVPLVNYYYYVPLLRNGNLFMGGILFYQLKNNPSAKKQYILLLLTLTVHFIINPIQEALAISFVYAVFYLFITNRLRILRTNALFFLGYISYPLYLLHQYIGYEVINYLDGFGLKSVFIKISITSLLLIITASVITFTVEQPAMKFLRKKIKP